MNSDPPNPNNANPSPLNFEPFTFVFERLADLLTNEIDYLRTDKVEEIKSLQQGVEIAQTLLKDVDQVQRQATLNHELQIKVRHVISILDEIEDFLDSQTATSSQPSRFSLVSSLKRKRSTVKGARQIKERLNDVVQSLKGYQLTTTAGGDSPFFVPRRRYQTQPDNLKQEFIVDLKEDVKSYVADLVTRKPADLAIFGMGGAGKTTTARLLYRHKVIMKQFKKRAWVCVSQQWDKSQLLHQISQQVGLHPPIDDDDARLVIRLKEFLRKNSCFFVLDDVWDVKALLELLPMLRSMSTSRVLVTTRNKEILNFPQNDFSIRKIRPLTRDESWILFTMTIRRNRRDDRGLEGEFLKLGNEMLEKCGGLPLAIVALGGLLSSKDTIQEWESIKDDVVRRIMRHKGSDDDYGVVTEILELSYFDLPYWLKPCFLYLGIFPEDFQIEAAMLIQLWIAEGFVKVEQDSCSMTVEKVGRDFLDELADRCMVEIVKKGYGGELIMIQIHDLMRDLCIRKAEGLRLFQILDRLPTSSSTSMDQNSCRIVFEDGEALVSNTNNQCFKVRSLFSFNIRADSKSFPLIEMKYLRVLCLYGVDLNKSTAQIGDLFLLRYLLLQRCNVSSENLLSIKKLRNLLSLTYLSGGNGWPANLVGKMEYLRHLCFRSAGAVVAELGVGKKPNLQTLKGNGGEWLITELPKASIVIQELSLDGIQNSAQLEAVYGFVSSRSQNLHNLFLGLRNSRLEIDLTKLKPRICSILHLNGKIMKTDQIEFPRRLVKLCLVNTQIGQQEQLKIALAQLDELRYLELESNAYVEEVLSMDGLVKLQELRFRDMSDLKEWRVENGALSKLEKMEIYSCENMERLPQQIRGINLTQLILDSMSPGFNNRLQHQSEDYYLVRHIPSVQFRSTLFQN